VRLQAPVTQRERDVVLSFKMILMFACLKILAPRAVRFVAILFCPTQLLFVSSGLAACFSHLISVSMPAESLVVAE
jgi:hypothetical protein